MVVSGLPPRPCLLVCIFGHWVYLVHHGIFAKIDKSNVAVARLFFELSMDPLVGNDCPISIFNGLGGNGMSFFDFGQ